MRRLFLPKLAGLALAISAFTPSSQATLLLTDDFTGYTLGNLGGQGSWTQSGSGPVATVTNISPLTFSGYNGGGGNYAVMPTPTGTASRCYEGFASTVAAGNTFYASFLLNLTTATATGNYFISLGDPTTGTTYAPRLFAKASGSGYVLGVSKLSNTGIYGTTELAFNTTYLVVIRYTCVTGTLNDQAYVWVNPSLSSEPATSGAECSDTAGNDGYTTGNVGNFHWHNRNASNPSGAFDAVRVAAATTSAAAWTDLAANTGSSVPTVTTQPGSSATTTGATLNGTVTANGGASLTDRGFYWSDSPGITTSSTKLAEGGTTVAAFSKALAGLNVNQVYYYRAYAVNATGTGIGPADVSFYTLANTPVAPTVNSPTASSLNVAIGTDGNPSTTAYAIKEAGGLFVQAGGNLGASAVYQLASTWGTITVSGLVPSTTYNFSVQATNGAGVATAFGPSAPGATSAGTVAPVVSTQPASSITTGSAVLNGTVVSDGGSAITDRGFYWSSAPGVSTGVPQLSAGGTAVGSFSATLSPLDVNTLYYYRAYAVNSIGTTLDAADASFSTLANTPFAPIVDSPSSSTLRVKIPTDDGNPMDTIYAIQEVASAKYVQTNGTLGVAAVYQDAWTWGTKTVTGLSGGTTYNFQVKAQNRTGTDTAFSPTASGTTTVSLAGWDFTGADTVATWPAAAFNANLDSANTVTRGPGAAASAGNNSFRTTGFKNEGISTANTDYFEVTLSASPGNVLSLSRIDARFAGTASFCASPGATGQFAYSLDGTTFTLIEPSFILTANGSMPTLPLSDVSALQNVPASVTVYIRYYASGQTTTGGWGFNSPSTGLYGLDFGGTATACTPPAAPASPSATAACGKVTLGWSAVGGATGYNIYRSTTSGSYGAPLYTGVIGTSYDDTGAAPGTNYFYKITAASSGCESPLASSTEVSAGSLTPGITLGSNPATCRGSTSASLTYSATTGSPNRYSVDFDTTAEAQGFVDVNLATLPAGSITISVPAAAAAGAYNAVLTVKNNTTGCVSSTYPITVSVNTFALPAVTNVVFGENMGAAGSSGVDVTTYTGWQNTSPITFGSSSTLHPDVRNTSASTTYAGASGGGNVYFAAATGARNFEISGINTLGFPSPQLQFGLKVDASVPTDPLVVEVSDDGTTYSALTLTTPTATTWGLITPTGTIPATSNLRIRFSKSTTAVYRLDDIQITSSVSGATSASITTSDPTTFCSGGSATLHATAGGSHYTWLKDGLAAPGATDSATYSATVTGNYTVTITDPNGCTATSSATAITVNNCSSLASVTISTITGTTLTYGGGTGTKFVLLKSSNAAALLNTWTRVDTNFTGSGSFTIPAVGTGSPVFYSIKSE